MKVLDELRTGKLLENQKERIVQAKPGRKARQARWNTHIEKTLQNKLGKKALQVKCVYDQYKPRKHTGFQNTIVRVDGCQR